MSESMAVVAGEQIVVDIETVDQLFNAPDANPFGAGESTILGEAAVDRVLLQLQVHPLRNWEGAQLVVRLPEDQVTPDLEPRLSAAMSRYCAARIEDNHLQVRLGRKQHAFGMIAVILLVLAVMLVAYLLFTTVIPEAPTTIQALVVASISVFAWVILWDPLESLLFDWAPPARQNRALQHMMEMRLRVETKV
jgi:hypothetical protein